MKPVMRCYSLILAIGRQITNYPILAILLPLAVRTVPEILMGAWPIGFDVITYYAPYMHEVQRYGLITPFLGILLSQTAPLTYMVSGLLAFVIPLDSLILAKILSPLIYGFLGYAIYDFTKNIFSWKPQKALLATIISTSYFVTLRFSWDMWKNTLGLAFFLLSISNFEIGKNGKFLVYSLLCVFSHELMAFFLGAVLTVTMLNETLSKSTQGKIRLIFALLIIVFSFIGAAYYTEWIKIFLQPQPSIPNELILRREELTIPYNYLGGEDWYSYTCEWDARLEASMLMLKMFGPIILPSILGWKRNKWTDSYILISVLPFLSIILTPATAIPSWHRLAFLLAIPLLIHVTNFISDKKRMKPFFIAFLVIFMFGYTLFPSEVVFPYYGIFPSTYRYLPTSMLQNSVSKEDSANVMNILNWLNFQVVSKSCLLVHESYLGWAKLYINRETIDIIPYNMSSTVPEAAKKYYSHVYTIWWAENAKWNGESLPSQFRRINQMGRIAVYEYE